MSERPKMLTPDIFFCAVLSSVGKKKTPNPKQKLAKKQTNKPTQNHTHNPSHMHTTERPFMFLQFFRCNCNVLLQVIDLLPCHMLIFLMPVGKAILQ